MTAVSMRDEASPTGWFSRLTSGERRTFWACFGGWALDAMDVQMFSFLIPAIVATFGISNADAGLIGSVTLLTSAFGGWFAGILADRFGRVRTLQITIVWFAFFTFLCGFAQSYWQLLLFRALMGFGFGGEWAAGAILMGEVIRPQHRGKAVGAVHSGWPVGWGVAALMATLVFWLMPQDIAWRALFWVGIAPAILVLFVRRLVEEPEIYRAMNAKIAAGERRSSFLEIFSPRMLKTTVLTCLLSTGVQGGYYALFTWLPTFLRTERKLTVLGTGGYLAVVIIGAFIGLLVGAYLADRIGRRRNFMVFAAGSILTVVIYTQVPITDEMMLVLGLPLGFFATGIFAGMGALLTESYPTAIRGSGQGFTYNFGRGIASLNPTLVGLLSATLPLGQSIGLFALVAYGFVIAAVLMLPETKGQVLSANAT